MSARLHLLASLVSLLGLAGETAAAVVHYPPTASKINNFTFALHGSGSPGIYSSSTTPDNQYGEYNWCNMPHVRNREYKTPSREYTLEYVEVIQRHHKRTPYGSNTFFKEDVAWNCVGEGPLYGVRTAQGEGADVTGVQWQASTNPFNPWTTIIGPGFVGSTCQFPQITDQGLEDSITHGKDLRAVYAKRLNLDSYFNPSTSQIRVTNNQITSQVASGLVKGLFPSSSYIEVHIQSPTFDSLEPTYPCNKANQLKTAITTGSQAWNDHLSQAGDLYAKLDSISGIAPKDTSGWHTSFDHYYDNLSAKQCHQKPLPCNLNSTSSCVTQDIADTVYRIGNWEYSWQFRDAPESAQYSTLKYGAWILELKGHLQDKISGKSKMKYVHNVAHDGSISPLLGLLQIAKMVWPGMGSEVVFELYSKSNSYFIRVLWGGQPMETSTPLKRLDMVPINDFFSYIDSMVGSGSDLFAACNQ
ncbi:putative phosphoglycerate mutase-like protein [Lyophyllum shimeji]|uniref:Phosphoglycerate mutase-like protein n=1 Tax=Lyophyllum shimeji TaxID=47721 RepID=A0A9P3UPS8_LYOSH|nr:putative phosphoglycerate mutase-like protein [Lyophyllum shimeji]